MRTRDLGGSLGTQAFGAAVADRIEAQHGLAQHVRSDHVADLVDCSLCVMETGRIAVLTLITLVPDPIPVAIVGQKMVSNLNHDTLMAVPFFFFAPALMETGGLVRRLIDFANSLVGH